MTRTLIASTMHKLFFNDELLSLIVKYCDDDKSTLARISRTNKILRDVALPILWRSLDSIIPLLCLLPSEAMTLHKTVAVVTDARIYRFLDGVIRNPWDVWEVKVTPVLTSTYWTVFKKYAPFVRQIRFEDRIIGSYSVALEGNPHDKFLPASERSLLPRLTRLVCFPSCSEDLRFISHLLGGKLDTLHIISIESNDAFREVDSGFQRIVEEIQMRRPVLTDLTLLMPPWFHSGYAGNLNRVLATQSQLIRLFVNASALPSILRSGHVFSSLQRLRFSSSQSIVEIPHDSYVRSFPSLRSLSGTFDSSAQDLWNAFLISLGHNLVTIHLNDENEDAPAEITEVVEVITMIGQLCPHLQTLTLDYEWSGDPWDEFTGLLEPLIQCNELLTLELMDTTGWYDFSFVLSNPIIEQMATAWPRIEKLHLGSYRSAIEEDHECPPVSLAAVAILTEKCHKLQSLRLTVDARQIPPKPHLLPLSSLRSLHFGRSWIADPCDVAVWLGDVCPSEGIESSDDFEDDDDRTRMWTQVRKIAALLQASRREIEVSRGSQAAEIVV